MTTENELKFAPSPAFALPEFSTETGVSSVERLPVQNLRAVYYDTQDLVLSRNGITLRYRTGEDAGSVWTLKLPLPREQASAREELNYKGNGRTVPEEVTDLTRAFVRSDRLVPFTTLRTKRRRWLLRDEQDRPMAEVVDDEVSVLDGRKITGRFREVELEQQEASGKQLKRIAAALRGAGATDAEPIPKASRALSLHGPGKDESEAPAYPPGSAAAALQDALARDFRRLITNDPVTRLGIDVEGVHQMRVATRRLRSNLKSFGDMFDPTWRDELRDDLKWLAGLLGAVRDLDVLQERLAGRTTDLGADIAPLFDTLSRQHRRARSRLLEGLRSDRYEHLLGVLSKGATAPPATPTAEGNVDEVLLPVLASMWSELASQARSLGTDSSDEQRHGVRIEAKRLRYAIEAIETNLKDGALAAKFARRLSDIQDALGELQDAVVARSTLTSIATRGSKDPRFCIAIGRVIEREMRGAESSRAMFSDAWAKLDRKKNLTWLRT